MCVPQPSPPCLAVVCSLLCQNGGVCARPDSCVCPPEITGKFCHLPANSTWGYRAVPQNPGGHLALTQSIYTLPLANYWEEEDGEDLPNVTANGGERGVNGCCVSPPASINTPPQVPNPW